jgi:hypothetical protein
MSLARPTEKLTCLRRLSRCHQLYNHSQQMQKATMQQSAEGASQVQWVLARLGRPLRGLGESLRVTC